MRFYTPIVNVPNREYQSVVVAEYRRISKRCCVAFIMRDTETQIALEILDDIFY